MVYACFGPDFELPTVQAFLAERGQYPDEPPAYILYSNVSWFCYLYLKFQLSFLKSLLAEQVHDLGAG